MKHTDVAGQELEVGDSVAISVTGYRTMTVGTILRFTPKGMKVAFRNPFRHPAAVEETFREPGMVAKIQTGIRE